MEEKVEEVEAELIKKLAEFRHDEQVDSYLRIPYADLSERTKEEYREWAREVLEIIKKYPHIGFICMQQIDYELSDEEREMAKDLANPFR